MTENPKELFKRAALSIRALVKENEKLKEQEEIHKKAFKLVKQLVEQDGASGEEALSKLAEWEIKNSHDLRVIEEARDMARGQVKLGSLGDKTDNTMSADERFIQALIS